MKLNGHRDEIYEELKKKCIEVKENAYCPYSKFRVGCAVLSDKGNIYTGCNVENCSYGLTLCAETVAVSNAVATGDRNLIAIAVSTDLPPEKPKSLCGRCRQFVAEFGDSNMEIIMVNNDGTSFSVTLGELLPNAFTPKALLNNKSTAAAIDGVEFTIKEN